ncbi:MAG: cupredoxin family copper-binding protein [Burkholderiales bacterium]|nr:cupredoxin family copper-binding protein [Burkholderiales bacterium]
MALVPAVAGAAPGPAHPSASAAPAARELAVAIDGMRFVPAALAVRPGDRVTWINKDLVPHTVTARDGRFDSKAIAAGASFTWTASGKGHVDYACLYHPTMVATLTLP